MWAQIYTHCNSGSEPLLATTFIILCEASAHFYFISHYESLISIYFSFQGLVELHLWPLDPECFTLRLNCKQSNILSMTAHLLLAETRVEVSKSAFNARDLMPKSYTRTSRGCLQVLKSGKYRFLHICSFLVLYIKLVKEIWEFRYVQSPALQWGPLCS